MKQQDQGRLDIAGRYTLRRSSPGRPGCRSRAAAARIQRPVHASNMTAKGGEMKLHRRPKVHISKRVLILIGAALVLAIPAGIG